MLYNPIIRIIRYIKLRKISSKISNDKTKIASTLHTYIL